MRTIEQKLECLKAVICNSQRHVRAKDPRRIYSQYIRYALDEFVNLNLCSSVEARGLARKHIIYEHVVPHSIVMDRLLSLNQPTNDELLSVIRKFFIICTITREEDKRLNAAGLRSKMPEGWNDKSDSVYARYDAVGISIIERNSDVPPQASNQNQPNQALELTLVR